MRTRNYVFVLVAAMALLQVSGMAQTIQYLDANPMVMGWSEANQEWEQAGLFTVDGSPSTKYKVTIYRWYDVDLTYVDGDECPPAVEVTTDGYGDWFGYVTAIHYECPFVDGRFFLRLLDMSDQELDTDLVATDTPDPDACE